jgi:hypothetical protein
LTLILGIDSSSIQGDFELLGAGDILDLESDRYLFCPIAVLVTSEYRFEIPLLVAPIDKSHIQRIVAVACVLAPVEEEVLILVLQKVWTGHLVGHLSDCREIRLPKVPKIEGFHASIFQAPRHLAQQLEKARVVEQVDPVRAASMRVGRRRTQSAKATVLDRFFACFGTVAVAGSDAELQIAPRAAPAEPLTDESKFTQIATAQSAEDLSGMTTLAVCKIVRALLVRVTHH